MFSRPLLFHAIRILYPFAAICIEPCLPPSKLVIPNVNVPEWPDLFYEKLDVNSDLFLTF